jgi:hypothetical protein
MNKKYLIALIFGLFVLKIMNIIDIEYKYIGLTALVVVGIVSGSNNYENMISDEAIANIATIYDKDNMTVTNLTVTGALTVPGTVNGALNVTGATTLNGGLTVNGNANITGTTTLGNWKIRNDKIGIPDRGDMNFGTDKWMRLLEYDQPQLGKYTGNIGTGGFAGKNLHAETKLVAGSGSVGRWNIRDNKIGIPELGDIDLGADKFIRLLNYDHGSFSGGGLLVNAFAVQRGNDQHWFER